MNELEFILARYLKLREAIANWLRKHFDEAAWHFQPTPQSNAAAWIVPHLFVFEQIKVYDQIPGYTFPRLAADELVARYRPGAPGYSLRLEESMGLEEAIDYLAQARTITETFLGALLAGDPAVAGLDRRLVFDRYFLNFTHDTEHYGQLKYLTGTWQRRI
jgi:hypothetical protein